jgi:hypothetical protein
MCRAVMQRSCYGGDVIPAGIEDAAGGPHGPALQRGVIIVTAQQPDYTHAKVKPTWSGARPMEIPPWLWFRPCIWHIRRGAGKARGQHGKPVRHEIVIYAWVSA